jgi:hypothetical protein
MTCIIDTPRHTETTQPDHEEAPTRIRASRPGMAVRDSCRYAGERRRVRPRRVAGRRLAADRSRSGDSADDRPGQRLVGVWTCLLGELVLAGWLSNDAGLAVAASGAELPDPTARSVLSTLTDRLPRRWSACWWKDVCDLPAATDSVQASLIASGVWRYRLGPWWTLWIPRYTETDIAARAALLRRPTPPTLRWAVLAACTSYFTRIGRPSDGSLTTQFQDRLVQVPRADPAVASTLLEMIRGAQANLEFGHPYLPRFQVMGGGVGGGAC